MMIQYTDIKKRQAALQKLVGIENCVWVKIEGHEPVAAIADEDLERTTKDKTSAVHFLRFELSPGMINRVKQGASVGFAIEHPQYSYAVKKIPQPLLAQLQKDLA